MLDNFLVCLLTVLFIAFIFLFFALVAKVIDLIEERLKSEHDDKPDGEGKDDDNDDIMSHLYYEPWMYDDDFWK